MLTAFGREIRKLRLDREMLLGQMAEKLGISAAFVSAVETGRKKIPSDFIEKVKQILTLSDEDFNKLKKAADNSLDEIKIEVGGAPDYSREAALAFARRFGDMDEKKAKEILNILNKKS